MSVPRLDVSQDDAASEVHQRRELNCTRRSTAAVKVAPAYVIPGSVDVTVQPHNCYRSLMYRAPPLSQQLRPSDRVTCTKLFLFSGIFSRENFLGDFLKCRRESPSATRLAPESTAVSFVPVFPGLGSGRTQARTRRATSVTGLRIGQVEKAPGWGKMTCPYRRRRGSFGHDHQAGSEHCPPRFGRSHLASSCAEILRSQFNLETESLDGQRKSWPDSSALPSWEHGKLLLTTTATSPEKPGQERNFSRYEVTALRWE